jgi:uncharacterized YccA/Bax inhibitor family protein
MRSGNPVLNNNFLEVGSGRVLDGDHAMTLNGTVNKTFILLMLLVFTAAYTWRMVGPTGADPLLVPLMIGGALSAFAIAIATTFKPHWAPVSAPLYALTKGLAIGGISGLAELRYPGVVMQAVALTFGVLAALLMAYRTGLIKATENFKLGVVAATGGIFLVYLVHVGMQLFGMGGFSFVSGASTIGILFSLFVVVIAALNLVLDFDFIESGVDAGAPKYMEWYGAFGLMVTLAWLYLEILRLLSKLQSRD